MFSLVDKPNVVTDDLSEILVEMLKYGHPRVSHLNGGWHCNVEMNTNTTGSEFKIRSEFDMATPIAAAKQCHERILNTLKNITK